MRNKEKDTQVAILRTWIARRDGLLSESTAGIDKAISEIHSNTTFALDRIDNISKSVSGSEDLERLRQIKSAFAEYVASAEAQVNSQKDLLALRKRQIDITPAWDKAYGAVIASPDFLDSEIQADIQDGVSSMKDARIAYWRYSTLLQDEFTGIMHAAAEKAIASFNRAKSRATDAGLKSGIDGLLAVMSELNEITGGSKKILTSRFSKNVT